MNPAIRQRLALPGNKNAEPSFNWGYMIMPNLEIYDEARNSKLQSKRAAALVGSVIVGGIAMARLEHTFSNPLPAYQELITGMFSVFFVAAMFVAIGSLIVLLANMNNKLPITLEQIPEVKFYAREDADIALFVDEIQKSKNRMPVLDEYCQILGFAHERNLPIYHEYVKEQAWQSS